MVQTAIKMIEIQINPVTPPRISTRKVSGRPKKPTPSSGSSILPSTYSRYPISAYTTGLMNVFIREPVMARPTIARSAV